MKRLLVRLLNKLRWLFDFHQPRFRHIDCIDLVLENKLILLISWEAIHTSKICIRPGKIIYRTPISAAIFRLPAGTESVDIILHNFWRSRKLSFKLKRITVDRQTFQYFEEFFPERLAFANIQPVFAAAAIEVNQLRPNINLVIRVPIINISINQIQLNDYAP